MLNLQDGGVVIRLMEIHDKLLAEGPEALTEEDKAFVSAVAEALAPVVEKLVALFSELAQNVITLLLDAYAALPAETKALLISAQTQQPVVALSRPVMNSNLRIDSLHDHVGIEVTDIAALPVRAERLESRWRS